MKFPTRYSEKKPVYSQDGERYITEYVLALDDEGQEYLKESGQTDLFAMIQTHKDSVDLSLILAKLEAGDDSVLEQVEGFYADVSDMPVKLQDLYNINLRGMQIFDKLPVEVRNVYGNDYKAFIMEPEKMIEFMKPAEKPAEKEVKPDDDKEQ